MMEYWNGGMMEEWMTGMLEERENAVPSIP
jgi:hypothetical protein